MEPSEVEQTETQEIYPPVPQIEEASTSTKHEESKPVIVARKLKATAVTTTKFDREGIPPVCLTNPFSWDCVKALFWNFMKPNPVTMTSTVTMEAE